MKRFGVITGITLAVLVATSFGASAFAQNAVVNQQRINVGSTSDAQSNSKSNQKSNQDLNFQENSQGVHQAASIGLPSMISTSGPCPPQGVTAGLTSPLFGLGGGVTGDVTEFCKAFVIVQTLNQLVANDPGDREEITRWGMSMLCAADETARNTVPTTIRAKLVGACNPPANPTAQAPATPVAAAAVPTRVAAVRPTGASTASDVAQAVFPKTTPSEQYARMAELVQTYGPHYR